MGTEKAKLTYDSAKEKLGSLKEELTAKRDELAAWLKEKGIKKGEEPKEEKALKKYNRLKGEISDLEKTREELKEYVKNNKPKKERVAKYAYPAGATGDEKKKFRQKCRAAAKAAGVSLADYLADPAKFEKAVAEKKAAKEKEKAEKAEKKEKKAAKEAEGEKKEKKASKEGEADEKPKKKKKPAED